MPSLSSTEIIKILATGDLRSIGQVSKILNTVKTQSDFDELIKCVLHDDRRVAMRAIDAVEKITKIHSVFLSKHKRSIIKLMHNAIHKEIKWHLALIIPRLQLSGSDLKSVWLILNDWALNDSSRIVKVNALQALYDLSKRKETFLPAFVHVANQLKKQNIPSINARLKKLMK